MNRIFTELLEKRGLDGDFLRPKYLSDGELPDVKLAVERLCQAAERGERVLIYGDYDADGVTASTVMHDTLKLIGVEKVGISLPDRFRDGYGMSQRCVERAVREKVGLVVTVDCGSNNGEVISQLKEQGIDTIVTDHHEILGEMPECVAVVNPKRKDFSGREDLRDLAGVGVAFMVARELVLQGKIPEGQEKWMLDLVLIGTICDSMVMRGINRELCYYGMKVLERTRRLGLVELMKSAGVKRLSAEAVGFQLGPRINAAGRMKSAGGALRLLLASSRTEAVKLVEELEILNFERRERQRDAIKEIVEAGVGDEPVIVACGDWHEGILGIIAGKLVEEYRRPAFALAETESGIMKGSGRSFGEFSLAEALQACSDVIIGGGGHAGACGVKVATESLGDFRTKIGEYYRGLGLREQERYLDCKEDIVLKDFRDVDLELVEELAELEPYGLENEQPIFLLSEMFVLSAEKIGAQENHLKLILRGEDGKTMKIVGFYAREEWLGLCGGEIVDAWVTLGVNEFRGEKAVEGRLVRLAVK